MSTGVKISRTVALDLVRVLADELGLALDINSVETRWAVGGSLRRGCDLVGDIDLVCPLPAPGGGAGGGSSGVGGGDDRLCGQILRRFVWAPRAGDLFAPPLSGGRLGWIVSGARSGFKCCSLVVVRMGVEVKVQINRFVPGPMGNRGWTMLRVTGPAEFGPEFLALWKMRRGVGVAGRGGDAVTRGRGDTGTRGCEVPASDAGYLLDAGGAAVPTPTEERCFELCGIPFIEPARRTVDELRRLATRSAVGGVVGGGGDVASSSSSPRSLRPLRSIGSEDLNAEGAEGAEKSAERNAGRNGTSLSSSGSAA